MSKILELREKRAALVAQARQVLDAADKEKRGLSGEEQAKYDAMMKEVDTLKVDIDREERQLALEKELTTPNGASSATQPGTQPGEGRANASVTASPEYMRAFVAFLRQGPRADANDLRSLHVADDPQGGFFVPESMETQLRELLENENIMRRMVTVITSSTDKNIPFEDSYGTAQWLGEEKTFTESDAQFSTKQVGNHKLGTLIKVSEELLQDSTFDIIGYINRAFAKRYGRAEETAILSGNGVMKPRGVIMDATLGVTTAANNAITSDELIDLFHKLPRYHRRAAKWLMADLTAKVIRKLKNSVTGDYMWQPGLQAGQPDMILGKPLEISDDVPAFAASAKCLLFGDFKEYILVDRKQAVMQRLNELFALSGQVGFRGYKRLDGRLLRPAAVQYLQMKA